MGRTLRVGNIDARSNHRRSNRVGAAQLIYSEQMLALVKPSSRLLPYVDGYVFARDLLGEYSGRPIRTVPRPGAVLTVNLGRPNRTADGSATPAVSLLGVQTTARIWYSDEDTHLVMALLKPTGLARFAQAAGGEIADTFVDIGSLIGDRAASGLRDSMFSTPGGPVRALDAWLLTRILNERHGPDTRSAQAACKILSEVSRVDIAAERLGMSRRHLSRVISLHLGVSPKALIELYRLERSIGALQTRSGEAAKGYADQAHQIREWRRRLGITPGGYSREGCSTLAQGVSHAQRRFAFYL
jgi:AraC-like DNA-binding protein